MRKTGIATNQNALLRCEKREENALNSSKKKMYIEKHIDRLHKKRDVNSFLT